MYVRNSPKSLLPPQLQEVMGCCLFVNRISKNVYMEFQEIWEMGLPRY